VVSSAHVEESSSLVHLENSSVEVVGGGIELSAVSDIFLSVSFVVSVGGEELSDGKASAGILIESGHSNSGVGILEHNLLGVRRNPGIGDGLGIVGVNDLNKVGSISSIGSLSGVSSGVSVAASPLEVDVISDSGIEVLRDKIVLGGGVGLDNISSLSSDVQVVESSRSRDSRRSLGDLECE